MTAVFDVLIAGGGNAALCAAISAAEKGCSVCIVESAPRAMRGGNTRHTRNVRVAHDAGNGILTGPYPVAEFMDDLERVTKGVMNRDLALMTLEKSKQVWDFLWAQGVRFQPSLGGTLSLGRTNAFFLGGGRSMLNALYRKAEDLGVQVRYDTVVIGLEFDGDLFSAARVRANWDASGNHKDADPDRASASPNEQDERIAARCFVAAAGGFEANIEWLRQAWGEAANNFLIRGTPYNRGGVLKLLLERGVEIIGDPKQCHAVAIDGRAPQFDGGIVTRLDCVPFGVVLNANARRFYDEGEDFWPKRYAIWGRLIAAEPDQVGHVIIDAQSMGQFMPSVFPPASADSLAGLAHKIGLDPTVMVDTINQFNAACQSGVFDHTVHDDCRTEGLTPPKSHWARPIVAPPFYAYTLRPGITFTYLSVGVDAQARIRMANGQAVPNLFAAGEIMAGNVLGQGYLAGIGMTIGSVFGRIAGEEAAQYVNA